MNISKKEELKQAEKITDHKAMSANNEANKKTEIREMLNLISELNPSAKSGIEYYRMYVFFDYNCSYCSKTAHAISGIKNKKNLNIHFIECPVLGYDSIELSKISMAIFNIYPEKYKDFHRLLITSSGVKKIKNAFKLAEKMDINTERIKQYIQKNSDSITETIKKNKLVAYEIGKSNTVPLIIINNTVLKGSVNAKQLEKIIEKISPIYNNSLSYSKIHK